MMKNEPMKQLQDIIIEVEGRQCRVLSQEKPECLVIQPVDEHDMEMLPQQVEIMAQEAEKPFMLVAFQVKDWNGELSPWDAPPVFGREPFGSGAADTLSFVVNGLLPAVLSRFALNDALPAVLGGYSLAGFFALWSAYQTDRFAAVAAVSPSVWFPGWSEYAAAHTPLSRNLYLSLGDREEKTKNQTMATVGDNIRLQHQILAQTEGITSVLEWNQGNHFQDADRRCARGFAWCLNQLPDES